MGFPNCGVSTHRNKLQTHMRAWLDPPPPCLGAQVVGEPGLLLLLPPQWGPSEGSGANYSEGHASPGSKRHWKYNPIISVYFYTEIETGEKAYQAFICNHCAASRSDAAGGICCRGFPHLLGFSSLLRLFDDQSLLWALSSHPLTLPRWLQQHFPEKDNEMGEQSSWAPLWQLFRHAPRFKFYLGIQFSLTLAVISRNIAQWKFTTLNYALHCLRKF